LVAIAQNEVFILDFDS